MVVKRVLDYVFTSPGITTVLRELNLRKTGITGREIARIVGITHRSALKALYNLELLKLVTRRPAGKAYYFTLNREHYICKKIIAPIFAAEDEFSFTLNQKIKKSIGKYAQSIIIFGSVARQEETLESDLDLCIIYKSGKRKIEDEINQLRTDLYNIFGISLAPYIISVSDFKMKAKNNESPVNNIIEEGKVIYGKSINTIING